MAQLRDAQTSELIGEGTPLEVALLAEQIGPDEVLFDDVGEGFDPAAVIQAHQEQRAGLKTAAKAEKDPKAKARLHAAAKAADAAADVAASVPDALDRLQAARELIQR